MPISPELAVILEAAKRHVMTPEGIRRQRIGYVASMTGAPRDLVEAICDGDYERAWRIREEKA